ncbi:hypothetical protein V5799_017484 [Amblyomma americanum]|uniref:Uncharacterized protein n=1 Tax=Amblyomma americanum TaxID=6943 RepID=A0AAQ4F349_AMBAM
MTYGVLDHRFFIPPTGRAQDAPWVPVGASVEGPRRVCNFSLDLGAPVHIVDDRFVSFNLDAALFQRSWDWLELDLENPRLVALCRSLSPSILRVGGATSNLLLFSEKNRTTPDPVRDWQNNVLYPEYKGPLVMHGKLHTRYTHRSSHRGAVIVFGLNLSNETAVLTPKDPELLSSHVMAYALGPDPAGDLVAEDVLLNGRPLALSESLQFPDIVPAVLHPRQGMAIAPYGMAFFVFADYKAPACTGTF